MAYDITACFTKQFLHPLFYSLPRPYDSSSDSFNPTKKHGCPNTAPDWCCIGPSHFLFLQEQ